MVDDEKPIEMRGRGGMLIGKLMLWKIVLDLIEMEEDERKKKEEQERQKWNEEPQPHE